MAGAGPYHHSMSNLDDSRKMLSNSSVGSPRFFIIPQSVPVNEPFHVYCTANPDGLYEFTCDDAIVEHVQGDNHAMITPESTGDCHVSARWFKNDGAEDCLYGNAKLAVVPVA